MFLGTERASLGLTRAQVNWLMTESYRHDHGISRDYAGHAAGLQHLAGESG